MSVAVNSRYTLSVVMSLHCLQGKMTKNVERELLNHSMLIHPHVVRFEECFLTDKYLAIVMEYAAGGNLFTHVTARSATILPRKAVDRYCLA